MRPDRPGLWARGSVALLVASAFAWGAPSALAAEADPLWDAYPLQEPSSGGAPSGDGGPAAAAQPERAAAASEPTSPTGTSGDDGSSPLPWLLAGGAVALAGAAGALFIAGRRRRDAPAGVSPSPAATPADAVTSPDAESPRGAPSPPPTASAPSNAGSSSPAASPPTSASSSPAASSTDAAPTPGVVTAAGAAPLPGGAETAPGGASSPSRAPSEPALIPTANGSGPALAPTRRRFARPAPTTGSGVAAPSHRRVRVDCVIAWEAEGGGGRFRAIATTESGDHRVVAQSAAFWWPEDRPPILTDTTLEAHAGLVDELLERGWRPTGGGFPWYARRFRRWEGSDDD